MINGDLTAYIFVGLFVLTIIVAIAWGIRDTRRIKARRRQRHAEQGDLKDAFQGIIKAWKEMPSHERDKLNQTVNQIFAPEKTLTTANVVVTYRANVDRPLTILTAAHSSDSVEEKLKEILAANPDANLTKFESALGIKIVDVQRKGQKKLSDEDNELGDIE
jgi:hypothetical protein